MISYPILCFTLGALAGLPLGYAAGPYVDATLSVAKVIWGLQWFNADALLLYIELQEARLRK